ncbi:SDR family NAD(P)-dependent oxidoreductase [Microbacterium murale]|uniref:NAD(P)-dependent dehydrogenase (Short-subunit alcohol dehydrogenase family) n=1 Tax=Microbacterium murale TaxID=1081040 RepID=A0ABU0P4P9_9MICO|nr:SDR family NAD(P)-dependent oxidoreductase [Microbacterium murale]MDQ0642305.1 NAD(P)-dependent dehydrogenase (short-subunit alcohol dehydrogenase family) [Microbacterium murale]
MLWTLNVQEDDMSDKKVIVITGGSDGIGAAGARRLHADGHQVVLVGRSPDKTRAVAHEVGAEYFLSDFARLDDVRDLAAALTAKHPRIDVLANNAGGMLGARVETVDGFEQTFQVNHLAPFLLTNLLQDTLIASGATVIQTASVAARLFGHIDMADLNNERAYSPLKAYGDAKLANILFTRELHTRFHARGVSTAAFHPGVIATGFAAGSTNSAMKFLYTNPVAKRFLRSSDAGADQLVWLAESLPGSAWKSGSYYEKRSIARRVNPQSTDDRLAAALWRESAAMTMRG